MSEHWCSTHNTPYFMKGKMQRYAHPVKDAQGNTLKDERGRDIWCNEDDAQLERPAPAPKTEAPWVPAINPDKQASIEAQNALTNLTNLAIAEILPPHMVEALIIALLSRTGINWGDCKGGLVEEAKKHGAKPKSQFKHMGEFLTRAHKEMGLQRPDVEAKIGPIDDSTDLDGAWLALENSN